jgi:hypothetical protein
MIADIAIIISVYAAARLLNEYVIVGDKPKDLRTWVGIIAVVVIGIFLISVISAANDISNLGI